MKALSDKAHAAVLAALDTYRETHGEVKYNSLLLNMKIENSKMSRSDTAQVWASLGKFIGRDGLPIGTDTDDEVDNYASESGEDTDDVTDIDFTPGQLQARLNAMARKIFGKENPKLKAFCKPDAGAASIAETLDKMGAAYNDRRPRKAGLAVQGTADE
jgi:hypothetical protein